MLRTRGTRPTCFSTHMSARSCLAESLAAGTFWSGLIDDVRIYNRAVNPIYVSHLRHNLL